MIVQEMTIAYVAAHHTTSSHSGSFFAKIFNGIVEIYKRRVAYLVTVNELRGLSDRELSDIGITRCEIEAVALKSAELA